MGTGHSVDTPIRVAPLGITSVISIVDDLLLERIRKHYSEKFALPYEKIPRYAQDGRARRITAYLETVAEIVHRKMDAVKSLPFFAENDKKKYFDLLPDGSHPKEEYAKFVGMSPGPERDRLEKDLTNAMVPGSIDVNIMVKLDRINLDKHGKPLSEEFSDAKAAFRGYANSTLRSGIVLSAGINQSLFGYMTRFKDFYRDATGELKKKIILKVTDFRSTLVQGRLLAKKGLEVFEFRIESGLNCGGHAFASNGHLLPSLLKEFKEKRDELVAEFQPLIHKYYEAMGWEYPKGIKATPLITVQGGIGTNGEARRMMEDFGMDRTGWASPFLLVPEATCVDDATRELLRQAGEDDLYLSGFSPLGVPFNNIRRSGSEISIRKKAEAGKPGSPCPKGFLVSNTEFTTVPICLASSEYQDQKLKELEASQLSAAEKEEARADIVDKACLCEHLGNGALIALGIVAESNSPQAICPGPNIAWFKKLYTLKEMVDHIYGRGESLVPPERPHMFAKEIEMYVDYFEKVVQRCTYTEMEVKKLREFKTNLENGMDLCLRFAEKVPYEGENLASIPRCVEKERARLNTIFAEFENEMLVTVPR
ncbi:MAG TPA: hypothetical protein VMF88_13445 [Bacteroidota bacterium]|nr:hypothetical protein [Bacteroidota bacterium]